MVASSQPTADRTGMAEAGGKKERTSRRPEQFDALVDHIASIYGHKRILARKIGNILNAASPFQRWSRPVQPLEIEDRTNKEAALFTSAGLPLELQWAFQYHLEKDAVALSRVCGILSRLDPGFVNSLGSSYLYDGYIEDPDHLIMHRLIGSLIRLLEGKHFTKDDMRRMAALVEVLEPGTELRIGIHQDGSGYDCLAPSRDRAQILQPA